MAAKFKNTPRFMAGIKKHMKAYEKELINEVRITALTVTRSFFLRTPVWSGATIVNYSWGRNRFSRKKRKPTGDWRGSSVGVALGSEVNRSQNEAPVIAELSKVSARFKLGDTLNLTNNGEIWDLIEHGNAPTPDRARNPGGVTKLAMQATFSKVGRHWKRGS